MVWSRFGLNPSMTALLRSTCRPLFKCRYKHNKQCTEECSSPQKSILSISIGNDTKYLDSLPSTNINRDRIWVPRKGVNSPSLVPVNKDLTLIGHEVPDSPDRHLTNLTPLWSYPNSLPSTYPTRAHEVLKGVSTPVSQQQEDPSLCFLTYLQWLTFPPSQEEK